MTSIRFSVLLASPRASGICRCTDFIRHSVHSLKMRQISPPNGAAPTFLGIGSQRCASSYLSDVLGDHPQVQMAPKELNFFNYNARHHDLDWYRGHFEGSDSNEHIKARGEISPNYAVMRKREIEWARQLFPELRVILVVRHPVNRMWSALRRHWTYSYLPDVADVGKDLPAMLSYADRRLNDAFGDYRTIYRNWRAVFGDALLMVRFERLQRQHDAVIRRILDFLQVESDLAFLDDDKSVLNQSKADVHMPPYFRYYLSRRYIDRTEKFNNLTGGAADEWLDEMSACITEGKPAWAFRYWLRSALRYYPMQWAHRVVDPIRTRWKVRRSQKMVVAQ